jgi:hypothetical protein
MGRTTEPVAMMMFLELIVSFFPSPDVTSIFPGKASFEVPLKVVILFYFIRY